VRLAEQEALPTVVANTVVWVAVVVAITLVISLGLAQFLNLEFPGRRVVRWALIVPWAASLIMTSKLFVWIYDYYFGVLNHALVSLGVLRQPIDWLGDDATVMGAMIAVGVFVSLPFTTYVVLAGLASIPDEVYEAARVDGASAWQRFWRITVPLMKPAILVALLFRTLDAFRIFDSVFIISNGNNPNIETVSILNANELLTRLNLGLGSAISVLIFLMVVAIAALFIKGFGAAAPGGLGED